ncbi:DUF3422 domain-containing protein [Sphingomonas sp. ASV193]|uniref:DUF3422 domain-containing protein n=1 Tax=Sphingomonas sp. ASV193 TaxID=3144405 RepID=UPI0032E91051
MREHDLRARAVSEMHLRRWPTLTVPSLVVQWVLLVAPAERESELRAVDAKARQQDPALASHREGSLGPGLHFTWEKQSEGSSVTLFCEGAGAADFLDPHSRPDLSDALKWAQSLPGDVIRSVRIWLVADDAEAEQVLPRIYLHDDELVSSRLAGPIRMWSDFRLKEDGFGRLVVAANGADPRDLTRQVQRLQELGNYRNRALLGLPLAQQYWPQLDAAEARLRELADRVSKPDERDDALLNSLSELSLELATISAAIDFRMDATRAYAQLVEERLHQLKGEPVDGFASLADFTQRRFRPAIATCIATVNRLERLAVRAEQLSSLLRVRIETRIENQNAQQLRSMERSASMQLRLQQLVEGLSVVALSYYLVGLLSYLLHGVPEDRLPARPEAILALAVIPLVAVIALVMLAMKKRLLREHRDD